MSAEPSAPAPPRAASSGVRRVEAVVNAASGGVGPGAAAALERLLAERGLEARVHEAQPRDVSAALSAALAASPDLLIVLAGDGTARLACELAGADGPLVAPLPGGTMNMLPFALYGRRPWREALVEALDRGVERRVSGGEVEGHVFFCAAILGAPALWGPAREALRHGKMRLAWLRALRALKRAFTGRLRYRLDGAPERKAEALSVICPLISRVLTDDVALEVAAIDPKGPAAGLWIASRTLLTDVLGDWRDDPAVRSSRGRRLAVRHRGRIPAVLDGEAHRLRADTLVSYRPAAFRALAPPEADGVAGATAAVDREQDVALAGAKAVQVARGAAAP